MPEFTLNQPIETRDPQIEVTSGNAPLPIGRLRFQLVVVDDAGNESLPSTVEVIVADTARPTAVLDAPEKVGFGESFKLSGERSVDIGGQIATYRWMLIEAPTPPRGPTRPTDPVIRPTDPVVRPIDPVVRPINPVINPDLGGTVRRPTPPQ